MLQHPARSRPQEPDGRIVTFNAETGKLQPKLRRPRQDIQRQSKHHIAAPGALLMLLFGLGTLPAMLAASLGAARVQAVLSRRGLQQLIGVFLLTAGAWTLVVTWMHGDHTAHGAGAAGQGSHHQQAH